VIRRLEHHRKFVGSLAHVPGIGVISASEDGTLAVWGDGDAPIAAIQVHLSAVNSIAPGPDGGLLSASDDGTAIVWSAGFVPLQILVGHEGYVSEIAALDDGRIVTAGHDATVRIWGADGELQRVIRHGAWVNSLAVHGTTIFAGSIDRDLRAWDAESGAELGRFGSATTATILENTPGDIVLGGTNRSGRGHRAFAQALAVAPDGTLFSVDRELVRWDRATSEPVFSADPEGFSLWSLAFGPDPAAVVVGGQGYVRLLDAATGGELARLRVSDAKVRAVLVHDGLVWAGCEDGVIATVPYAELVAAGTPLVHTQVVSVAVGSPSGRFAATAAGDCQTLLWDVATGTAIRAFRREEVFAKVAMFLDESRLAVGDWDGLSLIDVATGAARRAVGEQVHHAVRVDEGTLLTAGYEALSTWDLGSLVRRTFAEKCGFAAALASDGARAYVAPSTGPLQAWDLASGTRLWSAAAVAGDWTVVVAHGGRVLAATRLGAVFQLDPATGATLVEYPNHASGGVWEAAVVDGVVALGGNGVITTYDLREQRVLGRRFADAIVPRPEGCTAALAVGGRSLAGYADGRVSWSDPT
jgi:WD40 repeat protein